MLVSLLVSTRLSIPVEIADWPGCPQTKGNRYLQVTFTRGAELAPRSSPKGDLLAFEYFHPEQPNTPQIWIMNREQGFRSARPLVDNDNYNSWPSWSPDGEWISFMSHDMRKGVNLTSQIYKVRIADGTIVQLTHFPQGTVLGDSTSWSRDDRIAFEYDDDIYVVHSSGQNPEKLIDLKATLSESGLWGIEWSPDGSRLAFRGTLPGRPNGAGRIWVADSGSTHAVPVTYSDTDENPFWLDNRHLLFEHWEKTGEVRICVVSLSASKVTFLTDGHIDLNPSTDPKTCAIFLARGEIPKKNSDRWLPETHIYRLALDQEKQQTTCWMH
jgi:Tol biopolymer transport system component